MRSVAKAIGYVVSALGLGIVIFGLFAVADPQATQLSNDSNPFGSPPSMTQLVLHVSVGAVLLVWTGQPFADIRT